MTLRSWPRHELRHDGWRTITALLMPRLAHIDLLMDEVWSDPDSILEPRGRSLVNWAHDLGRNLVGRAIAIVTA